MILVNYDDSTGQVFPSLVVKASRRHKRLVPVLATTDNYLQFRFKRVNKMCKKEDRSDGKHATRGELIW